MAPVFLKALRYVIYSYPLYVCYLIKQAQINAQGSEKEEEHH
nr:Chain L, UQCRTT2 [Tetrahymena thermophila SB210]8B6J_l Chain l, UQCRTT2 [Tetrahymena thermophila SB210]8BQS_L Chain L, UQCRTT2 [Tetrahymena thermophila SB210]8BQS_l Chain l, UQCRTT2 [Tetrahymena thermophila SB210]8GYM_QL Chain QL, UQCRTT2 [Tetrahymena thermophila SB210]8GYM_Ql Chain Ql, UQCRTT2 [Tetrahymena thermophila SB210]8GYM_qL Chain qL, UQCRTT2 [Tetrahymena thermophila SB210]8GYM_ql Chain ql, UQCRTT2 [Tetrahymena thermophila SB210]8GZU_QL Chain QL, UQCRTT2 [Tetrahymena thermophila 